MLLLGLLALLLVGCQSRETPPVAANPLDALWDIHNETALINNLRIDPDRPAWQDPSAIEPALRLPDTVIWNRLRAGFRLQQWYQHPAVQAEKARLLRDPHFLSRATERSRRYLYHIANSVESRDMPAELALLPLIESAFNPFAHSSQQAAGLWQFIPGTAEHYGLRNNTWYDGRRDVLDATDAALNYLDYLHRFTEGDWLLALASYNAGEGRVQRARRQLSHDGDDPFWHLKLPAETRAYVPRLLAVAAIIDQHSKHRNLLYPVPNSPYFALVEDDGGQLDIALAAELAGISAEEMYLLNPGFTRAATEPSESLRLLLPLGTEERFQQGIAELAADQRLRWREHTVQRGDSLSTLARQYQTTVEAIREANGLRNTTIVAGRSLLIPAAAGTSTRNTASITQVVAPRSTVQASPVSATSAASHTVQSGDTLWRIARRYNTTPQQLAQWNQRPVDAPLKPGERLHLQASASSAGQSEVDYRVQQGDSLYRIANRFQVSVQDLVEWNRLPDNSTLRPGQRLKISAAP